MQPMHCTGISNAFPMCTAKLHVSPFIYNVTEISSYLNIVLRLGVAVGRFIMPFKGVVNSCFTCSYYLPSLVT